MATHDRAGEGPDRRRPRSGPPSSRSISAEYPGAAARLSLDAIFQPHVRLLRRAPGRRGGGLRRRGALRRIRRGQAHVRASGGPWARCGRSRAARADRARGARGRAARAEAGDRDAPARGDALLRARRLSLLRRVRGLRRGMPASSIATSVFYEKDLGPRISATRRSSSVALATLALALSRLRCGARTRLFDSGWVKRGWRRACRGGAARASVVDSGVVPEASLPDVAVPATGAIPLRWVRPVRIELRLRGHLALRRRRVVELHPAMSPNCRVYASAARLGAQIVLFGGVVPDVGPSLGDMWSWDGRSGRSHAARSPRRGRRRVGDARGRARALRRNGRRDVLQRHLDLGRQPTWTQVATTITPRRGARIDVDGRQLGGPVRRAGRAVRFLDDTWTWDGQAWT